jgi:hypothetical protein
MPEKVIHLPRLDQVLREEEVAPPLYPKRDAVQSFKHEVQSLHRETKLLSVAIDA